METLAWPLVVLVLGVVGMMVFRQPLSELMSGGRNAARKVVKTSDAQQQILKQKKDNPAVDEYFKGFESPMLAKAEAGILENLEQRRITEGPDRQKVLVRALAATYVLLQFEKILGSIWASQLEMLRLLNMTPEGLGVLQARSMYDNAKQQFPAYYEYYSFDQWMAYLQSFELISSDEARVFLTSSGREFLKHMITVGQPGPAHG